MQGWARVVSPRRVERADNIVDCFTWYICDFTVFLSSIEMTSHMKHIMKANLPTNDLCR